MRSRSSAILGVSVAALMSWSSAAGSQQAELPGFALNSFGMPGLLEMPTATGMPDGALAGTVAHSRLGTRGTVAFQIAPRLTGSFRYSDPLHFLRDRSFDLQFQLLDEGRYVPGVAIGARDFIGTGFLGGEYVVATKTVTPALRVTGGLGWGRFGSRGGFSNPLGALDDRFRTRPDGFAGDGGQLGLNKLFRGDAAIFGGVEYQLTDRVTVVAEYSSDAYVTETERTSYEQKTPLNFGLRYRTGPNSEATLYLLHGNAVGLQFSAVLDPRRPPAGTVRPGAPVPVAPRPTPAQGGDWSASWVETPEIGARVREVLEPPFEQEGLRLDGVEIDPGGRRVTIRMENERHEVQTRAEGRAARILTRAMPPSVEEFVLVHMSGGVAVASLTVQRSDLEELADTPDAAAAMRARAVAGDGFGLPGVGRFHQPLPEDATRLRWSIGPYFETSYFDPDSPIRGDVGLRGRASFAFSSNASINARVAARAVGNIGKGRTITPQDEAKLLDAGYVVTRSKSVLYYQDRLALERLTVDHVSRPGPQLYGRISAGYLERLYAGVSAEVLWAPPGSRLAVGAELNYSAQREPGSLTAISDTRAVTGHVSGYYDFGDGFMAQLDVGQYLAGDRGATLRLEREFANGVRVGAYATLTDMPFDVFGEGSFDKGISVSIPTSVFLGQPSRTRSTLSVQPVTRDGGARLNVSNRLFPLVRDHREAHRDRTWEAFWQ